MDLTPFGVRASAGSLRVGDGVVLPHAWSDSGVVAAPVSNGAQLLHLAIAMCVLNDTYREAKRLGLPLDGVTVEADGGFDEQWTSTGVTYSVTIDSSASAEDRARLLAAVDDVAEIPKAFRKGGPVTRVH
ncbi:OsmC family protein [Xylanimonas cellulosilytica DSM 15894]|uniref:OsmC family protein n=1 Tax=Xylanimonas cellulosilytica (strain DSM 15894 / JCM 12276 / CECT 5975 / KCTC 9989 / LMG 20990 / NBRC 107835 / XIL07) TaxID=446471 RepID=D1BVL3_XYLCX|nr:OsmC family protein [Xylanimonas cellulosilytica]ACZ31332.1 OsmC family protein [Xylanimonas cellulosilytica DSM 15894]